MPWALLLNLLKQGGPKLLAALPKLWPLLLDAKSRAALVNAARDLASQSPGRRLRGRVEGTALVAQGMVDNATSVAEKDLALSWVRRANNLARMLDVPVAGRGAKGVAVSSVKTQLAALQDEMRDYLGSPDAP